MEKKIRILLVLILFSSVKFCVSQTNFSQDTYILQNVMNGQCIIVGNNGQKGGPLWMYPRIWGSSTTVDVTNDQGRWLITPSVGNSYILTNLMNGQCAIVGNNGVAGGPLVMSDRQWGSDKTVDVTNDQGRWLLAPSTNGSYIIKNAQSGQCIIVANSGAPGGPLVMSDCIWGTDHTVDVTNDQGRWLLIKSRPSGASSIFYNNAGFGTNFTLVGLCTLPRPSILGVDTHMHQANGEVHPDVIPYPGHAGQYLMVWTPYPANWDSLSPDGHRDYGEYPCIASSTDKLHWTMLPGAPMPLVGPWGSMHFHADPDLLYGFNGAHYTLYFQVLGAEGSTSNIFDLNQPNQILWNGVTYFGGPWARMARSASVIRDGINNRFLMYYDGAQNDHASWWPGDTKLSVGRSTSWDGYTWETLNDGLPCISMPDVTGTGEVWHPSMRYFDGAYYAAAPANTTGEYDHADIYMWKSLDGVNWKRSVTPVINYQNLPHDAAFMSKDPSCGYRCSLMFEGSTMYLWVSYNLGSGDDMTCRIALYKSVVSTGTVLTYQVRDFDQGGKVITGTSRYYYTSQLPREYIIPTADNSISSGPGKDQEISMINSPNPFQSGTTISFQLPSVGEGNFASEIELNIYSIDGTLVKTLISNSLPSGAYSVDWDGNDNNGSLVANGTYICTLKNKEKILSTRKIIFQK